MSQNIPRVVIVGGGFAGLNAAKELARHPVQVTLVDRKNHHTFQPLLYQVATAGLSPGEIAVPIRAIFRGKKNVEVLLGEAVAFDLEARRVHFSDFDLDYHYLIVAAGARHSYFGHDEWEPLAPGLKTVEDALEIRRRVLLAFELAEREARVTGKHQMMTFAVVGGGPTGVELAGTLAEVARQALADDFRAIDPKRTRIVLVEAGPRVLPAYPEDLSRSAERQLRHLGVEVIDGCSVTGVDANGIHMDGKFISTMVTFWAAGVAASPLGRKLGKAVDRAGRVPVEQDCSLSGHPNVFVIGDLAAFSGADGKLLPGVAPPAMQQGTAVARNIARELRGEARQPFVYHDKGGLATIGRAAAVAEIGKLHLHGFIAWLLWLFVHIAYLVGFQNRILVLTQWAWSYFTYERSARLITGSNTLPSHPVAEPQEPPARRVA
jgi:NADH dehydrogenase